MNRDRNKTCQSCGTESPVSVNICGWCGSTRFISLHSTESTCADCQAAKDHNLPYCPSCKKKIEISHSLVPELASAAPASAQTPPAGGGLSPAVGPRTQDGLPSSSVIRKPIVRDIALDYVKHCEAYKTISDADLCRKLKSQLKSSGANKVVQRVETICSDDQLSSVEKRIAIAWALDTKDKLGTRTEGAIWLDGEKFTEKTAVGLGRKLGPDALHNLLCHQRLGKLQTDICKQGWLLDLHERRKELDAFASKHNKKGLIGSAKADLNCLLPKHELISLARERVNSVLAYRCNNIDTILRSGRLNYKSAWLLMSLPRDQFVDNEEEGGNRLQEDLAGAKALSLMIYMGRLIRTKAALPWYLIPLLMVPSAYGIFALELPSLQVSKKALIPGWCLYWFFFMPALWFSLRSIMTFVFWVCHRKWEQCINVSGLDISTEYSCSLDEIRSRQNNVSEMLARRLQCDIAKVGSPRLLRRVVRQIEDCSNNCRGGRASRGFSRLQVGSLSLLNTLCSAPAVFCLLVLLPPSSYLVLSRRAIRMQYGVASFWHSRVQSIPTMTRYIAAKKDLDRILKEHGAFLQHYAEEELGTILQVIEQNAPLQNIRDRMTSHEKVVADVASLVAKHEELSVLVDEVDRAFSVLQTRGAGVHEQARINRITRALAHTSNVRNPEDALRYYRTIHDQIKSTDRRIAEFVKIREEMSDLLRQANHLLSSLEPKVKGTSDYAGVQSQKQRLSQYNSQSLDLGEMQKMLETALRAEDYLRGLNTKVLLGEAMQKRYADLYAESAAEWAELTQHAPSNMSSVGALVGRAEIAAPSERASLYTEAATQLQKAIEQLDEYRRKTVKIRGGR